MLVSGESPPTWSCKPRHQIRVIKLEHGWSMIVQALESAALTSACTPQKNSIKCINFICGLVCIQDRWTLQIWTKLLYGWFLAIFCSFHSHLAWSADSGWCWQRAQLISRERHPGLRKEQRHRFPPTKCLLTAENWTSGPFCKLLLSSSFNIKRQLAMYVYSLAGISGGGDFGQNWSRSKSNWLHVDIFRFSFINVRYML